MVAYIEAKEVNLTFTPPNRAPVTALQNFNVSVEEGEFVSIVGPSGCGKSTFLNVLLGLIPPKSGEMAINGKRVEGPGQDREGTRTLSPPIGGPILSLSDSFHRFLSP